MLKFYFYNSYQGSLTGFQMTELLPNKTELAVAEYVDQRIQKAFMRGGILCTVTKTIDASPMFLVRNIKKRDAENGCFWYLNFAAVAELPEDQPVLTALIRNYFLRNDEFLNKFISFFEIRRNDKISYSVDASGLRSYMMSMDMDPGSKESAENAEVKSFMRILSELPDCMDSEEMFLLVTEAGMEYFRQGHSEFRGCQPMYILSSDDVDLLLRGNANKENAAKASDPSPSEEEKTPDMKILLLAGAVILIVFATIVIKQR